MWRIVCSCVLAALVSVSLSSRDAAAGLMCGRTVVVPGASSREVLEKCGPPSRRQGLDGKPLGGSRSSSAKKAGGGREIWVYDLGSRQLVRYLTFDRGRLRSIDFGGYGQ